MKVTLYPFLILIPRAIRGSDENSTLAGARFAFEVSALFTAGHLQTIPGIVFEFLHELFLLKSTQSAGLSSISPQVPRQRDCVSAASSNSVTLLHPAFSLRALILPLDLPTEVCSYSKLVNVSR
jgi:hypothetical protein